MATSVLIIGESGTGKTTSVKTLNPKETFYFNCDGKSMPFKGWRNTYNNKSKNYMKTSQLIEIRTMLQRIDKKGTHIKNVVIDTLNAIMIDIEMSANFRNRISGNEARQKWMDLAAEVYDLILNINDMRDDLIVYMFGHTCTYTDTDGNERKCLVTNGRKLEKIQLETKFPIVLCTHVEWGQEGANEYCFETQASGSTAKSPAEMFEDFKIPNDLALVSKAITEYEN